MHWLPEAGDSALKLLSSILTTALYSVCVVSLSAVRNVMELIRIHASILHFLHAVGFSHAVQSANFFMCFRNVAKSDYRRRHFSLFVCLPFRNEQLGFDWKDVRETWHFRIFRKPVERLQDGYFTWKIYRGEWGKFVTLFLNFWFCKWNERENDYNKTHNITCHSFFLQFWYPNILPLLVSNTKSVILKMSFMKTASKSASLI